MRYTLAIVGHGRSGKDTAGEWLGDHTYLRYKGSCSNLVNPLIAKELNMGEDECWNRRHENRQFWKDWCDEYRRDDPSRIAKACLEYADLVIGLRDRVELIVCRKEELFSQIIWIENPRVPVDPTVTFGPEDCDIIIYNDKDLSDFYVRLKRWLDFTPLRYITK